MSSLNNQLKNIKLTELLILIIILYLIQTLLNTLNIVYIDTQWIYIFVILYFAFKLKNSVKYVKTDFKKGFYHYRLIIFVVVLNIFVSYGFLYLADYLSGIFPFINNGLLSNSILSATLSVIIISPLFEELVFRGVFLNRLKLNFPILFSILISSLIFAALHSFGNITSAFIFAISMAILYIKSNNIFVPVLAHILNNILAEIIVFMDSGSVLFSNTDIFYIMAFLAVISFAILGYWIIKQLIIINVK